MYGRHTGKVILRLVEAVGESPSSQFLTEVITVSKSITISIALFGVI